VLEKAVEKVKSEMDKSQSNTYIQVVGDFLLQHLQGHPGDAEEILTEGKTIGKSLDEMRKVAQKQSAGGCAVLTDLEGYDVVLKYFGIKAKATLPATAPDPGPVQEKNPISFGVKLEDLL
jgi:hypothetical protein